MDAHKISVAFLGRNRCNLQREWCNYPGIGLGGYLILCNDELRIRIFRLITLVARRDDLAWTDLLPSCEMRSFLPAVTCIEGCPNDPAENLEGHSIDPRLPPGLVEESGFVLS